MIYPLISEYIKAIQSPEENFFQLSHLRSVKNEDGTPYLIKGESSVVFKMTDGERFYALKCFIREQYNRKDNYRLISSQLQTICSSYLISVQYLDSELFVDSIHADANRFPILLMDWIDGITLDRYVKDNIENRYKIESLFYNFCQFSAWLLIQDFAHGDLQPNNILVQPNGNLVLVDYDGMFVPSMKGQPAKDFKPSLFQHPLRTEEWFDKRIDDFSLAALSLTLKVILIRPDFIIKYGNKESLLFCRDDFKNLANSKLLKEILILAEDFELSRLLVLLISSFYRNILTKESFLFYHLNNSVENNQNSVFEWKRCYERGDAQEIATKDYWNVVYNSDYTIVLETPHKLGINYTIKDGVISIFDEAFLGCNFTSVILPVGLKTIGVSSFACCVNLLTISIPDSVTKIRDKAFASCSSLRSVCLSSSTSFIGDGAFNQCYKLTQIELPEKLQYLGAYSFADCRKLSCSLRIPSQISCIRKHAFANCKQLKRIILPSGLKTIEEYAFDGCSRLEDLYFPPKLTEIRIGAFIGCANLVSLKIPSSVKIIGEQAFMGCERLKIVEIKEGVEYIENDAFSGCSSLSLVCLPKSIKRIGFRAFYKCHNLTIVKIPMGAKRKYINLLKDSNNAAIVDLLVQKKDSQNS